MVKITNFRGFPSFFAKNRSGFVIFGKNGIFAITAIRPPKTMKRTLIPLLMATALTAGCDTGRYPVDTLATPNGKSLRVTFFKHASLAFEIAGRTIYVDPVSGFADYASLPKADFVLITHHHYDHFDPEAVAALTRPGTRIVCDRTTAGQIEAAGGEVYAAVAPGKELLLFDELRITAVAAYNTTEGHLQFHPRERADVGYLLDWDGLRLYVAGDGENTSEMKALHKVDVAFLPVNQPYTMTVAQAVDAVRAIRPGIFYPYHYGQVEEQTDLERLKRELEGVTEVRIRGME